MRKTITAATLALALGLSGCNLGRTITEGRTLGDITQRDEDAAAAVAGPIERGGKVYDRSECIGPVIMGRCHGTILPKKAYHPTCYGTWLNGRCTGPMF